MHPDQRHGSVWFEVSGFGRIRRDFLVDTPDDLANHPRELAHAVAGQIMLLDARLPKKEHLCRPVKIDILGAGHRRIYDLETFDIVLQQKL
jgi:hypothetical protein